MKNKSISTSGITPTNQKKHRGYAHIVNPKTGRGQNHHKTISVISDSPTDAEVLSTALMVCKENEIMEIIENFNVCDVVEITYKDDYSFEIKNILDKKK